MKAITVFAVSAVSILTIFTISEARADTAYTFIRHNCEAASKTATITVIYDWNESGKKKSQIKEKDVSAFGERRGTPIKKEWKCDLGDEQAISISAYLESLPRDDRMHLYFNGKELTHKRPVSMHLGPSHLLIRSNTLNEFQITYCPDSNSDLLADDEIADQKKNKQCQVIQVSGNVISSIKRVESQDTDDHQN